MWLTRVGVISRNTSTQPKIAIWAAVIVATSVCAVAWFGDPNQPNLTYHCSITPSVAQINREVRRWMRSGGLLQPIWHETAPHLTSSCGHRVCIIVPKKSKTVAFWFQCMAQHPRRFSSKSDKLFKIPNSWSHIRHWPRLP
jgi:hypothetical protein